MKKWKQATSILLGAAMAAGLTACGGGSAKETSAEAKQDATSAAAVKKVHLRRNRLLFVWYIIWESRQREMLWTKC